MISRNLKSGLTTLEIARATRRDSDPELAKLPGSNYRALRHPVTACPADDFRQDDKSEPSHGSVVNSLRGHLNQSEASSDVGAGLEHCGRSRAGLEQVWSRSGAGLEQRLHDMRA
eukprot:762824-Hanusia_phi.AAC.1